MQHKPVALVSGANKGIGLQIAIAATAERIRTAVARREPDHACPVGRDWGCITAAGLDPLDATVRNTAEEFGGTPGSR